MVKWEYSLEHQSKIYNLVFKKLKNFDFFQSLNFYVLPFLPQKFRNRVIYLPKERNDQKFFLKYFGKIKKLEAEWYFSEKNFFQN